MPVDSGKPDLGKFRPRLIASRRDRTVDRAGPAAILRIFTSEDARHERRPLYEAIVLAGREMHLAGATVLRSPMGFGPSGRLRTVRGWSLAACLPIVIEIIDSEEKITAFLPRLRDMMPEGLVTLERVRVVSGTEAEGVPQARRLPAEPVEG